MRNKMTILCLVSMIVPLFAVTSFASGKEQSNSNTPTIGTEDNIDWTIRLKQKRLQIIKLDNAIKKASGQSSNASIDSFDFKSLSAIPVRTGAQTTYGVNPISPQGRSNLTPIEKKNIKIDSYMNRMVLKLKSTQIINGVTFAFVDYNGMIMKLTEGDEVDLGYKISGITENHFKVTAMSGTTRIVGFLPSSTSGGIASYGSAGQTASGQSSDLSSIPLFDENGVPIEPLHLK